MVCKFVVSKSFLRTVSPATGIWKRLFKTADRVVSSILSQLGWTHYKILLRIDSQDKIDFYIAEAIKNNWTTRQLERQIHSSLWERLLMSNDKDSVLAVASK